MSNPEEYLSSEAPLSTEWGGDGGGVKHCPKCRETKPLDAFHKNKSQKDGLNHYCKACKAQYYAANVEMLQEQRCPKRAANAEAKREYDHAYKAANAEAIREYERAYYAANAEVRREKMRAYQATHIEAIREQQRAHRAANPDLYRAAKHRRRVRLNGNGGSFTPQELRHMRVTQGGICAYCQNFHGPRLTLEHIVPIKQGGRHEAGNICLACPRCNYSKKDRTPHQWLDRWYYDWRQRDPEYIPPHWYD